MYLSLFFPPAALINTYIIILVYGVTAFCDVLKGIDDAIVEQFWKPSHNNNFVDIPILHRLKIQLFNYCMFDQRSERCSHRKCTVAIFKIELGFKLARHMITLLDTLPP